MNFLRVTGSSKIVNRYRKGYNLWGETQKGDVLLVQDIYYDKGFKYLTTQESLPIYDLYRVGGLMGSHQYMAQSFVYKYGHLEKKHFLDPVSLISLSYTKAVQQLCFDHYGYKTPKTMFFSITKKNIGLIKKIICEQFGFPIVIKDPTLDRGEGVEKIEASQDLSNYLDACVGNIRNKFVLVQERYPAICDYRILVMGKRVLGCMKRSNRYGFRHNIAQGGVPEVIHLPKYIYQAAIQVTSHMGLGIGGVDFFLDEQIQPIFIEVNKMPQYMGIQKVSGIDFLLELEAYLQEITPY